MATLSVAVQLKVIAVAVVLYPSVNIALLFKAIAGAAVSTHNACTDGDNEPVVFQVLRYVLQFEYHVCMPFARPEAEYLAMTVLAAVCVELFMTPSIVTLQ